MEEHIMSKEAIEGACICILNRIIMNKDVGSPKDADPEDLWAHLKIKYKDGDEIVDENSLIWDVWRVKNGYVLYCAETKETIEVPRPEKLGGES